MPELTPERLQELDKESNKEIAAVQRARVQTQDLGAILQMQKDGFTVEQIAEVLGYTPSQITVLLGEKVEVGSPEQVLQEALRTVVSLIPLADAQYRLAPTLSFAQALTALVNSAQELIQRIYELKDKEETFKLILLEVLQPFCRQMIKDLMYETSQLAQSEMGTPGSPIRHEELTRFSRLLGTRFSEAYRDYNDHLASILGISPEARAKIVLGNNLDKS